MAFSIIKNRWGAVFKNNGAWLHPLPLFLFLLLSLSSAKQNTTYMLPYIYLYFIYLCVVRYADKHGVFYVHSFALLCFFVPWLCVASYLLSERLFVAFSFILNRPTPPPFHGTESVATPFLNFFIFLFSKIFLLKKCSMIYLHFVCVYVGTEYLHLGVVCV